MENFLFYRDAGCYYLYFEVLKSDWRTDRLTNRAHAQYEWYTQFKLSYVLSRLICLRCARLLLGSLQIFGTMRHTDIIFSKLAFSILEDTWISYYYVY